jgi:hypothetical protein
MPRHPDHAAHDRTLVAAAAANDLEGAALAEATERLASCPDCAALHADLLAIASALGELPAPVRSRDFTITAEQAAALRPTGWRRLVAGFRSPRGAIVRPLAVTFTTLGLVGLLLAAVPAAVPLGMLGGAGDAAGSGDREYALDALQSAGGSPSVEAAAPEVAPSGDGVEAPSDQAAAPGASLPADAPKTTEEAVAGSGGPSPIAIASIALLGLGLGLLAVSLVGRRARAG